MSVWEFTVTERLGVLLADDIPIMLEVVKPFLQKEFQVLRALAQR
jgi:hypothetical protein